jgi:hypothetical protein
MLTPEIMKAVEQKIDGVLSLTATSEDFGMERRIVRKALGDPRFEVDVKLRSTSDFGFCQRFGSE